MNRAIISLRNNLTKFYLKTEGRAGRQEYLVFFAFWIFINLIPITITLFLDSPNVAITILGVLGIFNLYMIVPMITLSVRRLHDFGQSGILTILILVAGLLFHIILLVIPGDPAPNKYGDLPEKLW